MAFKVGIQYITAYTGQMAFKVGIQYITAYTGQMVLKLAKWLSNGLDSFKMVCVGGLNRSVTYTS